MAVEDQSRNRCLTVFAVVSFVVAIVSFCVAVFAAAGGVAHEDDIATIKTTIVPIAGPAGGAPDVVLRVGTASGVPGYPSASSLYAGSGFWTNKKSLPTATSDFQAVSAGDKVYLIGGQTPNSNTSLPPVVLDTLIEYDTALEKYTTLPSMPAPRMRFGAAIHGGKIYVINGLVADDGSGPVKTTFVYDIAARTWSQGPETAVARSDTCAAASKSGKIYVVAGYTTDFVTLKSVEVMDATASAPAWSTAADLPAKRGDVTCASSGDKIYAIGGYYDPTGVWAANSFHNSMFELDAAAAAAAWKNKTDMPSARGDKAAVTLSDGSIVVVGGEGHARGEVTQIAQHPVEQYFPEHNTWIKKASIPTARFRFAAAAVGDFVHAFGGHVLCETGWNGDWGNPDCATKTLDSHQVLLDVNHPDVWIHTSKQ